MNKTMRGAIVWFVVTLFVVYSFCLNTAAAVFANAIKMTLHTNDLGVSIAVSAFIVGFACMQIPAGYLLDRYNAKFIVSSGVLLLALGNICITFSTTLLMFVLSNLLQGIGASFAFIAAGILISQWFPTKMFPVLFGLTQTMSCILSGVLHYIFLLQLESHSWTSIYAYLGIFGAILFVLTLLFVKTPDDFKRTTMPSLKQSLMIVGKNSQIWLCTIAAATSLGILLAYASFWYLDVQKYYFVQTNEAAVISGMIFIGIGVGTPLLGWLSNLVKSRKMILHTNLVLGTMTLLLGLYLPHFNLNTLVIIKLVSFFIGFFLSSSMLFYTVVSEISSDQTRGVALSITNTGVFLFNTLMMFIPYFFMTAISTTFFAYLWVLPFSVMIAVLITYFINETYSHEKE